ncbi:MAG: nucleotidyltransferase domain-containing protein [Candidatus Lokiarchaeota archaeon]|nr:nucleotidyltransferase domain-containing protein [Candidatus Lokiarchaeota archaeon]
MVEKKQITRISNDFQKIISKKNILGILLYGSVAKIIETNKSDIDICVVAPNEDKHQLISFILQNLNVELKKFDVRLFSELPLYIKIQIIEKGILIYSPDKLELYEYFYFYRKLWADQKHRQEISKEELLSI